MQDIDIWEEQSRLPATRRLENKLAPGRMEKKTVLSSEVQSVYACVCVCVCVCMCVCDLCM